VLGTRMCPKMHCQQSHFQQRDGSDLNFRSSVGTVVHTSNPSTQKAEDQAFKASLGYILRLCLKGKKKQSLGLALQT
jgi:hypothetical protein